MDTVVVLLILLASSTGYQLREVPMPGGMAECRPLETDARFAHQFERAGLVLAAPPACFQRKP
jgi:hypothetical protein